MAQQASSVEDLTDVVRVSLTVMCKQWSDAMQIFHEKFKSLSTLIIDNGLDSSPKEEFLSLLCGACTSPPVHQFLVNSLGEVGVKRVAKIISSAGKELQLIVHDHLQAYVDSGVIMGQTGHLQNDVQKYGNIEYMKCTPANGFFPDDKAHSIFKIAGATKVAIETSSFSKYAGFTGVRLGWTVVPKQLLFKDFSISSPL